MGTPNASVAPSLTEAAAGHLQATVHLVAQNTVAFTAVDLWPLQGAYSRFGGTLDSFAEEIARRMHSDGYLGFHADGASITIIPVGSIKRIDFTVLT